MIPWCPHSVLSGMLGGPSPCAWAVVPSVSWGTCWDRGEEAGAGAVAAYGVRATALTSEGHPG